MCLPHPTKSKLKHIVERYGASPSHRALSPILHQQFDWGPRRVFCRAGSDRWLRSYDRVETRDRVPKVCKVRLTVHLQLIGTTVISLDSLHVRSCYVHLRLHVALTGSKFQWIILKASYGNGTNKFSNFKTQNRDSTSISRTDLFLRTTEVLNKMQLHDNSQRM